jgi:hypothetical protein
MSEISNSISGKEASGKVGPSGPEQHADIENGDVGIQGNDEALLEQIGYKQVCEDLLLSRVYNNQSF